MNIGVTQSQMSIVAVQFSRPASKAQESLPGGEARSSVAAADVVEVNTRVDAGFVSQVLQDSLEERLDAALQKAGVEMSASELLASGTDTSPQATAGRIVEFAVSFYAAYQGNQQDEERTAQLQGFVELIKGAVEEGFAGAREVLSGFAELSEGIQEDIDQTFELTMKGIDRFAEEQRKAMGEGEAEVGAI